jgi:hypothetical protein
VPGQRDILESRSTARREVLDAPQDELALTVGDAEELTFGDLEAIETAVTAVRDALAGTSTASRVELAE